jgi:hypothetical protein
MAEHRDWMRQFAHMVSLELWKRKQTKFVTGGIASYTPGKRIENLQK